MNPRIPFFIVVSTIFLLVFSYGAVAKEKMSHTKKQDIPAEGVEKVRFRNIDFTDFSYTGGEDNKSFSVNIKYTIETDDEEEFEEMLSEFNLEISTSDGILNINLIHPKWRKRPKLFFWCRDIEWRVTMDVTGPKEVDMDIDADFSEIKTDCTSGNLAFNADFSDVTSHDHSGMLRMNLDFGSLDAEMLDGGFDIKSDFAEVDLKLANLASDSQVSIDFGNADIRLPVNTGAEFYVDKSFGQVNFQTSGTLTSEDEKGRHRILNNGGCHINLSTSFGSITIKDNLPEYTGTVSRTDKDVKRVVKEKDTSPPEPIFEEGVIKSIAVRGTHFLEKDEVNDLLDVRMDKHYKRNEISEAVKNLRDKNRFISSASFTIDPDGNLKVYVHEVKPITKDFDVRASFSRVAGLGFGPELKIKSMIGPLSELSGSGEYHWGNNEWTYGIRGEKSLFDKNRLALGGTYRLDYESAMDWAIPAHDSHLNAFLLGLETKNYYQVDGTTAYISQSLTDIFTAKVEYFDEDYSSVKKNHNWSFFNNRHIKENNPPLTASSVGRLTGMRYSFHLQKNTSFTNTALYLEMEKTFDNRADTLPEYVRFFGNAAYNIRLPYRHIIKLRAAGGHSDDALPDQKSFRLGGLNTLRGYDYGDVPEPQAGKNGFFNHTGGNRMFLANIDYFTGRYDDDWRFIFFGDAGGVWNKGKSVDMKDLKRDLGIGIAFSGDFFNTPDISSRKFDNVFRINWAVPVGNVPHVSHWTVNFVRAY